MITARYELIGERKVAVLEKRVRNIDVARRLATLKAENQSDEPFMVVNLTTLVDRFLLWNRVLPRVEPYYAVKCNNDPVLVRVLAELGVGFDCASKTEIDQVVRECGVSPAKRILYANPCKTRSFVTHASAVGVQLMTFDSAEELTKIKADHHDPQLILRFAIGDPTAQCPLSVKFGCDPPLPEGLRLLRLAKAMDMTIVGVSFHVGSGCNTPSVFREAVTIARQLFDIGRGVGHSNMHILDIGGGFPGDDDCKVTFEEIADIVRPVVDELFPTERIIAEPGRFFASAPVSETANVIASTRVDASRITKNDADADKDGYMYYINDGVYGSFNCILFDHAHPKGGPLFGGDGSESEYPTTVWGPTCDGLDQVEVETRMRQLSIGDWLYYPHMGAYTSVAATRFNGFDKPKFYYVIDDDTWQFLFVDKPTTVDDAMGGGERAAEQHDETSTGV